jgi:hypothetical protein
MRLANKSPFPSSSFLFYQQNIELFKGFFRNKHVTLKKLFHHRQSSNGLSLELVCYMHNPKTQNRKLNFKHEHNHKMISKQQSNKLYPKKHWVLDNKIKNKSWTYTLLVGTISKLSSIFIVLRMNNANIPTNFLT